MVVICVLTRSEGIQRQRSQSLGFRDMEVEEGFNGLCHCTSGNGTASSHDMLHCLTLKEKLLAKGCWWIGGYCSKLFWEQHGIHPLDHVILFQMSSSNLDFIIT